MVTQRDSYTMDQATKDIVREAALRLGSGMDKSKLIRYLINEWAKLGIGRVMAFRFGNTETIMGKSADPIQGDVQVLLPSVPLANGMVLDLQLRIPAKGMGDNEFAKTFALNQSYIQTVVDRIEQEIGAH